MISRRNFLSICVVMATILILFQFSILVRDLSSDYDVNVYLTGTELTRGDVRNEPPEGGTVQTVLYIGGEADAEARIIRQWCGYTKRRFAQYRSLEEYVRPEDGDLALLCLAGAAVTTGAQVQMLSDMVDAGQDVLFCDVSDASRLTQLQSLRTLLGIQSVARERIELTGVHLFRGFMLGGEVIYSMEEEEEKLDQEVHLSAAWYLRRSGTKVYMMGTLADESIENEELPPLIWRNSHGRGRVFAVNGPYMRDETGMGILSAILYELQDYDFYPVVNAQSLSVANFPDFAQENLAAMTDIYARDMRQFQMDLMWPNLIAAANKGKYRMTCFLAPRLDYSVRDTRQTDDLTFYLKQFREQGTEAGLSADHLPGVSLEDKLADDRAFFDSTSSAYSYGAAYVSDEERDAFLSGGGQGILKDIRTITGVWEDADLLSYCTDTIVAQSVTADGFLHTYRQDLRVRAIETVLAYSNILLDMKHISWPGEDDAHWEVLSEIFSSNINTYWNPFAVFDKTTLSESDGRARAFLAAGCRSTRQADTVTVEITGGGQWFLLRTHAETIRGISGGDCVEIEEDSYLIHASEQTLQIELEARENKQYFIP